MCVTIFDRISDQDKFAEMVSPKVLSLVSMMSALPTDNLRLVLKYLRSLTSLIKVIIGILP